MTHDKIQFSNAVIDEMVYLLPDAAKLTISLNNANELTLIAGNNVSTLLLYLPKSGADMSEESLLSLHKLASAVKLSTEHYLAINLKNHANLLFKDFASMPNIKQVICFGITGEMIGLHLDYLIYKPFIFNNLNILISDSLEGISQDDKKLLWHGLQLMFKLNI